MTRIRSVEDLIQVIIDVRRAGELLAHPCSCTERPGKPHMLGEHIWHATKDMRPGVRAAIPETRGNGTGEEPDLNDGPDPHDRYRSKLEAAQSFALDVTALIQALRPDRLEVVAAPSSDDNWCRACLAAGYCEPRFRDESLCRWCCEYRATWRIEPPADIVTLRHTGQNRKITVGQIVASNKAERKRLNAEKRKAKTA